MKCKHSFNSIGTRNGLYVWWCNKCGCVEQGGNTDTLFPSNVVVKNPFIEKIKHLGRLLYDKITRYIN